MNCEINALSAISPVHWAKKLYKITHLSNSVQIIEIHQFPHCASVNVNFGGAKLYPYLSLITLQCS